MRKKRALRAPQALEARRHAATRPDREEWQP